VTDDAEQAYAELLRSARSLLDAVAACAAPAASAHEAAALVQKAQSLLVPFATTEQLAPSGNRPELPGRGHPILPPFLLDSSSADAVSGRVTFSRQHLGGGGMAHGGVLPLLFDELLGRLVSEGRPTSRTAYLQVNYRHVTPLDAEVSFACQVDRIEGRKLYATGELHQGETLLAEAEGLFVVLLPGQA
jgi:acyl-coenzyme A thioesterase PaaI-like protein